MSRRCEKCYKCIHKIPIMSAWSNGCELWDCKYEPNNYESGRLEGIRKFVEWLECSGFNYNEEEAFWCRTHFDGKMFVEEVYTTNELLNLYEKEHK